MLKIYWGNILRTVCFVSGACMIANVHPVVALFIGVPAACVILRRARPWA